MEKAVILTSGGINSAVAAAIAREQCQLALLHIAWGHRTGWRELACFEQLVAFFKAETTLVADMSCLASFSTCARASKKVAIEDADTLGHGTPATFMLGLLPSMLSMAVCWAGAIGAKRIFVGVTEDHHVPGPAISDLYPDYHREFVQVYNLLIHYAKPANRDLVIEAPLMELSRAEVLRLGSLMNVPFDSTWSCYAEGQEPCGRCRGCATRAAGFLQAQIPDPLMLEPVGAGK